jgi:hypothetical protein
VNPVFLFAPPKIIDKLLDFIETIALDDFQNFHFPALKQLDSLRQELLF